MVDPTENDASSELLAAVDLGSNSFHLVIARLAGDALQVVDRLRDPVRLAAEVDATRRLSDAGLDRMVQSLRRFRQRLGGVAPARIRAIGTNTFRTAREPADLLVRACAALGSPIEVLSGVEEARLIWLGVSHDQPETAGNRLVVDIGGGSTECILGLGFEPVRLESLYMGCVEYSRRFFAGGRITSAAFAAAELAAMVELARVQRRFVEAGWTSCVGSSGTVRAIAEVCGGTIEPASLAALRDRLIAFETVEAIDLAGVSPDRRSVLAGGLAILAAVFAAFEIDAMTASAAALREGVLYDLLGRIRSEDVRDRTIRALSKRFDVDGAQADRVERTALCCLHQVADAWELERAECARMLGWAARMHEIGLSLSFRGYHSHGAYILENADMPGFSRQEQLRLSVLVGSHRRKPARGLDALVPEWRQTVSRLSALLRIAVRLHRTRCDSDVDAVLGVHARNGRLLLSLPAAWLDAHPLTRADLDAEVRLMANTDVELEVAEAADE